MARDLRANQASCITQDAFKSHAQVRRCLVRKRKVRQKNIFQLLVLLVIHWASLS